MSLALYLNNQLLSSGTRARSAIVHLNGNIEIPVSFYRRMSPHPRRRVGSYPIESYFGVLLCHLPEKDKKWVRDTANVFQKQLHDDAPRFYYPKGHGLIPTRNGRVIFVEREPVRMTKPAKSVVLSDNEVVRIVANSTYSSRASQGGLASLEVGRQLVIRYGQDFEALSHSLGVIKKFVLTP